MDDAAKKEQVINMTKEFRLSGSEMSPFGIFDSHSKSKTLELPLENELKLSFFFEATSFNVENTSAMQLVSVGSSSQFSFFKSRSVKFWLYKFGLNPDGPSNSREMELGSGSVTIAQIMTRTVPLIFPKQWRDRQRAAEFYNTHFNTKWENVKLIVQYPIFPNSLQNPRCLDFSNEPMKFSISTPSTIAFNITKNLTQEDLKALSDVEIVCKEETLPGHSLLMAAACKVFREKFTKSEEGNKKVVLKDVHPNVMKKFYDFMLNNQLKDLELNEVEDLLKLAVRFEFTSLHDACAQVLINGLSKSNAVLRLHFALKFGSPALEDKAKKIVLSDMANFARTKDFTLLMSDFPDAFQKS